MTTIKTSEYPDLIEIINETYRDEVERIISARFDDAGDIICVAQDGKKQLAVKISDSDIRIKLMNPKDIAADEPEETSGGGNTAQMSAPDQDIVDIYVDRLRQRQPIKPWLEQAKELLLQAPDLESFGKELVEKYPDIPSDDFNQLMQDALTAASMAGYFDAEEESD